MNQYWKVSTDRITGNINFKVIPNPELEIEAGPVPYLRVPYHSQWEADARRFKSDCGPACVEMVGEYYAGNSTDITTDDIMTWITGGVNRTTSSAELVEVCKALYNVDLVRKVATWEKLKSEILLTRPPIVLVHYGSFSMRMDRGYTSGHWMVVTGFDSIDYQGQTIERITVHDPDWWGLNVAQGAHIPIVKDHFMNMWGTCNLDGNPNYLALLSNKE